ncbi:LOW QUALITY PROTEIN: endo-1,4-beta-xylanase 1-like [Pecten maximus]|uniref:LOW QUALITY PROTEIN: endo-1,4-beta-xylanase 1-like n=1 Tax=Pecten maximus TaxID=6579 RepID=UPI001458EA1B|nr:LOW QUALITY PROTEIN: endo-1,4-beta-xylanase 1-like [Pecten maximus]
MGELVTSERPASMDVVLLVLSFVALTNGATELLKNPDFESTSFSGNWVCQGCSLSSSSDSYHGHHSAKITQRHHNWAGLAQTINVSPGNRYIFSAHVKLLNMARGRMFHKVQVIVKETIHGHDTYLDLADSPKVRTDSGWVEVGFDFQVPNNLHQVYIYLQIAEPEVNYLVDSASFKLLPSDSNWKTEANARINNIRKAPITVNLHNLHGDGYQVEIQQTKSKFAFGSAVAADKIVDSTHRAYQQFFYDNFEWSVLGNALNGGKWNGVKVILTLTSQWPLYMLFVQKVLRSEVTICFGGLTGHIPDWIDGMGQSTLIQAMHTHINDVISRTRGSLEHWDVYNENLHGMYFEEHTGHANITMEMFNWIHQAEPGVKLFLNEYSVASSRQLTTAYKQQAVELKNAGVPLYGIGIQCHTNSHMDITTLKYRLDKIAEAGLPIWITEFTVNEANEGLKADALENMMTLFMSHPAVEGVLLWGFWDGQIWLPNSALATGSNVQPNAAGKRYQQLFHQTWRTHVTKSVTGSTVHATGFMGDYTLKIKHNGHTVKTQHFTLDKGGKTVTVNL